MQSHPFFNNKQYFYIEYRTPKRTPKYYFSFFIFRS